MLFNSLTFLLFFGLVLLVHNAPLPWRFKKASLLVSSYLFYAAWNPPFVLLLALSTLVDWRVAQRIAAASSHTARRAWLIVSLGVNLGVLALFKYAGFLLTNFNWLLQQGGWQWQITDPGWILPMGISFYTFQTLSYTLDIYFGRLRPWHSFLDYGLFVSFFPQLVAGPIVRARDFLPQTRRQAEVGPSTLSLGMALIIIGLLQKVVLADTLFAPLVDSVFGQAAAPDATSAWLAGALFSAQIFCDFSGYSLCAIGCALCLGFRLPINFHSPFAATGFSDFWRRWHISLSSWLRDYLYIPLGGNRSGRRRTYINLMLTMLLGGLWHGAAWTFVVWGGLHGAFLIAERGLRHSRWFARLSALPGAQYVGAGITLLAVILAFVVFRATSFEQATAIWQAMLGLGNGQAIVAWDLVSQLATAAFVIMLLLQWRYRDRMLGDVLQTMSPAMRGCLLALAVILLMIGSGRSDAFIYFQF